MYHNVCPLVRTETSTTPYPASECVPHPGTKEEGTHSPVVDGVWGVPISDDWRKSLGRLRVRGWGVPIRTTGEKALHCVYSVKTPIINIRLSARLRL